MGAAAGEVTLRASVLSQKSVNRSIRRAAKVRRGRGTPTRDPDRDPDRDRAVEAGDSAAFHREAVAVVADRLVRLLTGFIRQGD